ncbi:MAG: hypothetical protein HGJ93_17890 [Desulfosarcina sp.]|nr:hypothetical protein [Desulfosarcina sp.]MBC2767754.1 hypothetical protein [Desulfosarcina sp.]
MTKLTDEILMAYADGELEDKQADDIRKAIETDSEALKRVEMFRDSATMLQGVYDAPLQETVPERLIETVMSFKADKPAPGLIERVVAFLRMPPSWKSAYAIASVTLLIGAGMGYFATHITQPDRKHTSMILNGGDFSLGLETTASGQFFTIKDRGIQLMPVATFLDKSNRYCRQYDVVTGQDKNVRISQGIACRNQSGKWLTMITINSHPSDPLPADTNSGYIPAGDDDFVDIIFSQIMASPPITLERESELIDQAWAGAPD